MYPKPQADLGANDEPIPVMPAVLETKAARVGDDSISLSFGSRGGDWCASADGVSRRCEAYAI